MLLMFWKLEGESLVENNRQKELARNNFGISHQSLISHYCPSREKKKKELKVLLYDLSNYILYLDQLSL